MPTYRSITTSLVSQFDLLTIPEYPPPRIPKDPFCPVPALINPTEAVVSVYIPTYPSSQFWISYSISPPYPPKALYYFKLFLNGSCIVSWGCSKENEYRGKTMFALYDSGKTRNGLPEFERRVLCFGSGDGDSKNSLGDVMEMRVYRSRGRKRIQPVLESFLDPFSGINQKNSKKTNEAGINLANAGIPGDGRLPKYYKYMLIDPLDRPFATFRYFYRNWNQLQAIGVISPASSTNTSIHSQESYSSLAPATSLRTLLSDLPANTASSPLDINSQTPPSNIVPGISNSPVSVEPPELRATAPPSEDIRSTSRLISPKQSQPLVSALKTRKSPRSSSISVASSFASLIRRSPSPVKTVSAYRQPAQEPRASSLRVLKDVLNSAVKRRAKAESEIEDTLETHYERI